MQNSGFTQHDIVKNYFTDTQSGINVSVKETAVINPPDDKKLGLSVLKAKGNIDIEGFTDKLKSLLDEAWEDGWGTFTMEAPTGNDPEDILVPVISFDVVSRTPSKGKIGVKARPTEIMLDPDNEDYTLILHRQWFDCVVEYVIYERTNRAARALMGRLEAFLEAYKGYFKEEGISEMIFQGEVDTRLSRRFKDAIPSTCLHYFIVLERILVERVKTTKEIRAKILHANRSSSQQTEYGLDIISRR